MLAESSLSSKALGEDHFLPLASFWQLPAILGIHWLVDMLPQSLLHSSHVSSLCEYVSVALIPIVPYKDTSHWVRAHLKLILLT